MCFSAACGTSFDFHKQMDHLFLVGTEDGKIHKVRSVVVRQEGVEGEYLLITGSTHPLLRTLKIVLNVQTLLQYVFLQCVPERVSSDLTLEVILEAILSKLA